MEEFICQVINLQTNSGIELLITFPDRKTLQVSFKISGFFSGYYHVCYSFSEIREAFDKNKDGLIRDLLHRLTRDVYEARDRLTI